MLRHTGTVLGADDSLFLGKDLIVWILLALGGALFAGNILAIVRPPAPAPGEKRPARAPVARTALMAAIGFVVFVSALAALVLRD